MAIRTTTYTCTTVVAADGGSSSNVEQLLIATTAALMDTSDHLTFHHETSGTTTTGTTTLSVVTVDKFTTTTTTTQYVGWKDSVRALLASNGDIVTEESWLDVTEQCLVAPLRKGTQEEAAVTECLTKLQDHLNQTPKNNFLLNADGTTAGPTVMDVLVGEALAAALEFCGMTDRKVPAVVQTWLGAVLDRLVETLPYCIIPNWREFGLRRYDCWKRWKPMFVTTESSGAAPTTVPDLQAESVVAAANKAEIDPNNAITSKLQEFGIPFDLYNHDACMTADDLVANVPIPSTESHTKNLFLRDKKHGHFLVTVATASAVNTKELGAKLGLTGKVNLRLADEATLDAKLHVKPGCVGPLGMALAEPAEDDKEQVKFVLDSKLLTYDYIHSHPLRNDQSVKVTPKALQDYLQKAGVTPVLLEFAAQGDKPTGPQAPATGGETKKKEPAKKPAAGAAVKKDAGKKGETKLALQCTKSENFPQWYTDVIVLSEMISYYDISGCYILRPWSYKIWELVQVWFNGKIQELGVENAYFPLFVSQDRLEREKDHVEGFAPEVAWVTKSGDGDLARPIAIRPTSETIMYPAYADWIQSHRDLPLKLNQWSNVVRWEFKYPTPFLRTREFLWQEGHTAHATFEEANQMVMDALDLYRRVYEELMAVPVVPGYKTEAEKFAGGYRTTTVEAYIAGSGRAIQGATSHHLGQNFGKMFGITFQNDKGVTETAWQTSWGLTTRTIGVCVMVHGDDTGLVMPPRVAPLQVVIVPVVSKKFTTEQADAYCEAVLKDLVDNGIRAKYDGRTIYTPGWKYNHWEQKGVPIRLEVGPRDVENKSVRMVLRYNGDKSDMPIEALGATLVPKLEEIQASMFDKAKEARDQHIVQVTDWKDFVPNLEKNNLVLTPWCGGEHQDWEEHVKEKSREESLAARGEEGEDEKTSTSVAAKTLCIPFDQPELPAGTKCLVSGMDATCWVLWGRSY